MHSESPISAGSANKVGGEAVSASPISSGTAAKVGMVDGAEFHAGSHGSAVPTACGVNTELGAGESTSCSTLTDSDIWGKLAPSSCKRARVV